MSVQDQDEGTRSAFAILIPLIVLVVGFVVGLGVHKAKGPATKSATQAATAAVVDESQARVVVENGVVKFYFESGKADLAVGAAEALVDAMEAAGAGKKLVLSGFHDATGNPAQNAELAKQRALAVRDVLLAVGVAEGMIELKKPEQLMGTGSNAEARRVDVVVTE